MGCCQSSDAAAVEIVLPTADGKRVKIPSTKATVATAATSAPIDQMTVNTEQSVSFTGVGTNSAAPRGGTSVSLDDDVSGAAIEVATNGQDDMFIAHDQRVSPMGGDFLTPTRHGVAQRYAAALEPPRFSAQQPPRAKSCPTIALPLVAQVPMAMPLNDAANGLISSRRMLKHGTSIYKNTESNPLVLRAPRSEAATTLTRDDDDVVSEQVAEVSLGMEANHAGEEVPFSPEDPLLSFVDFVSRSVAQNASLPGSQGDSQARLRRDTESIVVPSEGMSTRLQNVMWGETVNLFPRSPYDSRSATQTVAPELPPSAPLTFSNMATHAQAGAVSRTLAQSVKNWRLDVAIAARQKC